MMKRITVAIHERTGRQARVWAAEHDASLSAVVAYLLETLPGVPRAARLPIRPKPVRPKSISPNSIGPNSISPNSINQGSTNPTPIATGRPSHHPGRTLRRAKARPESCRTLPPQLKSLFSIA
jgi:hypothetical protein